MGLPGCLFVCHLILLLMCFLFNFPSEFDTNMHEKWGGTFIQLKMSGGAH